MGNSKIPNTNNKHGLDIGHRESNLYNAGFAFQRTDTLTGFTNTNTGFTKNTIVALLLVTNANGSKKRQFLGRASFGEDSQTS